MKRLKLLGICVAAAAGVAGLATASANASLPEYRYCVKAEPAKTGEYTDKGCSVHAEPPGTGAWELVSWEGEAKRTFTANIGDTEHDQYIPESETEPWRGGIVVTEFTCKGGSIEGEITGAKTSLQTITLKTCTFEGKKCTSAGQTAGVIVTHPLLGELGYGAGGGVLTRLSPVEGTAVADYLCEGFEDHTTGSLMGVDSGDVNEINKTSVTTFNVNAKGGQSQVFGEFPAGNGPFYLNTYVTPPGAEYAEGFKGTASYKYRSAVMIMA